MSEDIIEDGKVHYPESPQAQIDRLAQYIMEHVPGEPSQSQGAVDTAIRLLKHSLKLQAKLKLWRCCYLV